MPNPDVVYVVQEGATLQRDGERLHVTVQRQRRQSFSLVGLRQLILMGNITLTPRALETLVARGIDTVLLGHRGQYRGRVVGTTSTNVRLRVRQFELLRDEPSALEVARTIVEGKLRNQRRLLLRRSARPRPADVVRAAAALRAATLALPNTKSLDEVRGHEGAGARAYFSVWGLLLQSSGLSFDGRNRRPPMDPVNALLSFAYTLLHNFVGGAVEIVGLDPHLGALHEMMAGRPSLVCDLVEEFRAPVVDALVLTAVNRRVFTPAHFPESLPGEPVLLSREVVRRLLTAFERRLSSRVTDPHSGDTRAIREIIELQVRRFARHVLGEEPYRPFVPR